MINKQTLTFLKNIKKNNNRPWFTENKPVFIEAQNNVKEFAQKIENNLNEIDVIAGHKIYRIYRDVRFSKDKTPYKTYFHIYFERAGKNRRGGYWLGIEPSQSMAGGGFYGPEKDDLFRIRKELEMDAKGLKKVIENDTFKKHFKVLQGDSLKTAPRDFDKEHPNIELIRMKQFYAMEAFNDKAVLSASFENEVMESFKAIRPFFNYMTDVLTTNLNGESIL